MNIPEALHNIADAVMTALSYKRYPIDKIDSIIGTIETIISDSSCQNECGEHMKSAGGDYLLFFLSNILYNLKRKEELVLTGDVIKWLGSVWKNFLQRNKSYQLYLTIMEEYRTIIGKYYPPGQSAIGRLENVNLVVDDFLSDAESEEGSLRKLEKFFLSASEIMSVMKPTYYFLLDYYYERKINLDMDSPDSVALEAGGLAGFGVENYTYRDIAIVACKALGILEAAYLVLKKKKSSRRLVTMDGKQKFLTAPEIYRMYLERFNEMKKEITALGR
jgi:hypothetical protein